MNTLTKREARLVVDTPNTDCPSGLRNRCVLQLLYTAGVTTGELVALRVDDLDLRQGTLTVGEGRSRRVLAVQPQALDLLRRWIHQHPGGPWLLPVISGDRAGMQMSGGNVRDAVSLAGERAGIDRDRVSPTILRDTFAVELASEGWTAEELQQVLGFVDRRAAEKYLRAPRPEIGGRLADRAQQRRLVTEPTELEARVEAIEQRLEIIERDRDPLTHEEATVTS